MLYSKYKCYCGFENVIKFKKPTLRTKAWLESDCLSCGARYDIRIYPHENGSQVNIHKRIITMSPEVKRAIEQDAKQVAFKYEDNGVLDGAEERIKKSTSN